MAIPVIHSPGDSGRLVIVDSTGGVHYPPSGLMVRSVPFSRQSDPLKLAFGHGARDVSDGTYMPRVLELYYSQAGSDDSSFLTAWDTMVEKLVVLDDFWLRAGSRMIKIRRVLEFNESFGNGCRLRMGEYACRLLAEDPRWYKVTASVHDLSTAGVSPYQFTIYVGGTAEIHPVILISNVANNHDFKLQHLGDDAARSLQVEDPDADAGTEVEIDCYAGTVVRDGTTSVAKYATGLFLRMLPNRDNVLEYTGASAGIRITHRWAYL